MSNPFPKNNDVGDGKEHSKAFDSKVTTPDEDQRKLEKLYNIVDSRIEEHTREIKSEILQIKQMTQVNTDNLNQLLAALQGQPANAPQPQQGQQLNWQAIPMDVKAEAFGQLADGVSKIVAAWKGGSQQQVSPFGQLGEQMVTDLVRATVDDIQQRVYGIRKLPPPGVAGSSRAIPHGFQPTE